MTRSTLLAAIAAALVFTPVSAHDQAQRRSATAPPDSTGRPAPVQVPRHPYAGAWNGSLEMKDAAGAAKSEPLAMSFAVKDGARQAYSGETRLGGQILAHTNISSAPDAAAEASSAAPLRRSSGSAPTTGGPSVAAPEMDTLAAGTHAMLVHHSPTKSMLLCDQGGRCVTLATLTWEERDRDGRRYAYTARLTGADTIEGTVVVTDANGQTRTGRMMLKRTN